MCQSLVDVARVYPDDLTITRAACGSMWNLVLGKTRRQSSTHQEDSRGMPGWTIYCCLVCALGSSALRFSDTSKIH